MLQSSLRRFRCLEALEEASYRCTPGCVELFFLIWCERVQVQQSDESNKLAGGDVVAFINRIKGIANRITVDDD